MFFLLIINFGFLYSFMCTQNINLKRNPTKKKIRRKLHINKNTIPLQRNVLRLVWIYMYMHLKRVFIMSKT